MILVDSNVWIYHYNGDPAGTLLEPFLADSRVVCHPWIVGEVILGIPHEDRARVLADLATFPMLAVQRPGDVLAFIAENRLSGGVRWVDVNLLCSALKAHVGIVTTDNKLSRLANRFNLAHRANPAHA